MKLGLISEHRIMDRLSGVCFSVDWFINIKFIHVRYAYAAPAV